MLTLLVIANVTPLGYFGLACLILLCFGLPIELIINVYRKPKKLTKGQRRELAINGVNKWEFLIVLLPIWLILIVFFADDYSDRTFSMVLVGLGYTGLILSPYNRRIDIALINFMIVFVCLFLLVAAVSIQFNVIELSKAEDIKFLYAPTAAYVYLIFSRAIIKSLTGTYPITLDKYYGVGEFNERYNRKTNWWDAVWSLFNFTVVLVGVLFFVKNI